METEPATRSSCPSRIASSPRASRHPQSPARSSAPQTHWNESYLTRRTPKPAATPALRPWAQLPPVRRTRRSTAAAA